MLLPEGSYELAEVLLFKKLYEVSYYNEPSPPDMTRDGIHQHIDEVIVLMDFVLRERGRRNNTPRSETEATLASLKHTFLDMKKDPGPENMTGYKLCAIGKSDMNWKRMSSMSTDSFLDVLIEAKKDGKTFRRNIRKFPHWTCDDKKVTPKVIVLKGEVGSGRTAICRYIFDSFLSNSIRIITDLQEFQLVVPVQASTVSTCDVLEFLRPTIGESMDLCNPEDLPVFIDTSRILWLIDGLEEATEEGKKLVETLLALQHKNSHLVLLTTQPQVDVSEVFPCVSKEAMIEVYLQGLSKQGVADFLWNGLGKERRKFTKELKLIGEGLLKECHNPMKLKLMVELWKDGRLSKEAGASSLYEAIVATRTEKVKAKLEKETLPNVKNIPNVTNISETVRAWMIGEFEKYLG